MKVAGRAATARMALDDRLAEIRDGLMALDPNDAASLRDILLDVVDAMRSIEIDVRGIQKKQAHDRRVLAELDR